MAKDFDKEEVLTVFGKLNFSAIKNQRSIQAFKYEAGRSLQAGRYSNKENFDNVILTVSPPEGCWPTPEQCMEAYILFSTVWGLVDCQMSFEEFLSGSDENLLEGVINKQIIGDVLAVLRREGSSFVLRIDHMNDGLGK